MTRAHGIDISVNQITFNAMVNPNDIQFVIIRACSGLNPDQKFEAFSKAIAPVPVRGAYHYFSSRRDWQEQADLFLSLVKNKGFHFYALDVEPPSAEFFPKIAKTYLSKKLADGARRWLEHVSERARIPMLFYTNPNTYQRLQNLEADWLDKWPLWIAQYWNTPSRDKHPGWPKDFAKPAWTFYQYSADGNMKGADYGVGSRDVDLDVYNGTMEELRQWLGLAGRKPADKGAKVQPADSGYTWLDVINAAQKVDGKRFGTWLKKAGVDDVLADNALLSQPYNGVPIRRWQTIPDARAEILQELGEDWQPDNGRFLDYTWLDVINAARQVDGKRFGVWLRKVGVMAVLSDKTLLNQPYSGRPIASWPIEQRSKMAIQARLDRVLETKATKAAKLNRARGERKQDEGDGRPDYTWQDVIDTAQEVDDQRFGSWLKAAGVKKVLADRTLLTQPYSGRPINKWPIQADKKKEILRRLESIPKPIKDPVKSKKGEEIKLNVTYISQFDVEAGSHDADCGPTCLAMILRSAGTPQSNINVDALYRNHLPSKTSKAYTTLGEMKHIANKEHLGAGYNQYKNETQALAGLRQTIRAGRPFVALVNYGAWEDTVHWGFRGGHFVVVTGYDENNVFVHDPLFRNPRRDQGKFYKWPNEKFLAGWGTVDPPHKSPNINFAYVYTKKTIAHLPG